MQSWRALLVALFGLTSVALPGTVVAAQDQAAEIACTAEPRDLDELLALWFDAEGKPVATPEMTAPVADLAALPHGEPLSAASLTAIDRRTREWIACLVVYSQFARAYSFLTDDLIVMFGPDRASLEQDSPEEVRALMVAQLAGTPIPGYEGTATLPSIIGPEEGRQLPDGRIGALWTLEDDQVFIIYKQVNDRWLIDGIIDVLE